ncbi:MAG: hypothetical protein WBL25_14655 [Anaerolineales bacterium]
MKTAPVSSPISLNVIILALLFAAIVYIGATGKKFPLLPNVRVDILLLIVIGMTICALGGIGRVATTGQWLHPLSIIGYLLGGLILIVASAVFFGWKLPFIQSDQQALLAIAILAGIKVVNAMAHSFLFPGV